MVKRHLGEVQKAFRWYQRTIGTTVIWYAFDRAATTKDDIYDEGPERRWKPGFVLPVLHVARTERAETAREEGYYDMGSAHLVISPHQAAAAGLDDPWDAESQLFDRFLWDGTVFEVRTWQIQGRMRRFEVVVGATAQEVAPEEYFNDPHFPVPPKA
jgi:hypothetical protein